MFGKNAFFWNRLDENELRGVKEELEGIECGSGHGVSRDSGEASSIAGVSSRAAQSACRPAHHK